MAQAGRRHAAISNPPSKSRRCSNLEGEADGNEATRSDQRKADINNEEAEENNGHDEAELSTQAISELETDITTFIRNTGRNDGWPDVFQKHVRERGDELLERLRIGTAKREQAEKSFQDTFHPFLAGCLARVGVRPIEPQRPFPIDDPCPENQPLFTKSSTLIQESRTLLQEYSDLAALRVDTSSRHKLLNTLAKEEAAIEEAIRAGRCVAQAEIAGLLGSVHDAPIQNSDSGSAVLKLGQQEMQARARERGEFVAGRKTEKWAVVAAETIKAFGRISRVAEVDDMVD